MQNSLLVMWKPQIRKKKIDGRDKIFIRGSYQTFGCSLYIEQILIKYIPNSKKLQHKFVSEGGGICKTTIPARYVNYQRLFREIHVKYASA